MRLSNSQLNTYTLCSMKWKYEKIDRLRTTKLPSALFFGSALDEAFSLLLLSKKEDLTELELTLQLTKTAEEVFEEKMLVVKSNGEEVELARSPLADYYASDFAPELLTKKHEALLQVIEPTYSLVNFIDFHLQCKEQIRERKKLQVEDQVLYNYMTWLSFVEKGKLMIEAYRTQILPQIEKVYDIQKPVSISNSDGDEITGFIDFVASFEDAPGVKYITDNKSSSKPYPEDAVRTSQQLSVYTEAEGTDKGAYVVIEKKIFKRAPFIRASILKDTIPEETLQKTFDDFEKAVYSIEQGKFEKNEDSCFAFGRMCEFYKLCKYGSMEDLVKLKD